MIRTGLMLIFSIAAGLAWTQGNEQLSMLSLSLAILTLASYLIPDRAEGVHAGGGLAKAKGIEKTTGAAPDHRAEIDPWPADDNMYRKWIREKTPLIVSVINRPIIKGELTGINEKELTLLVATGGRASSSMLITRSSVQHIGPETLEAHELNEKYRQWKARKPPLLIRCYGDAPAFRGVLTEINNEYLTFANRKGEGGLNSMIIMRSAIYHIGADGGR